MCKIRAEGAKNFAKKTPLYKKTPPLVMFRFGTRGGGFLSGIPLMPENSPTSVVVHTKVLRIVQDTHGLTYELQWESSI